MVNYCTMAPNLVDSAKSLFQSTLPDEANSAEPLQIINRDKSGQKVHAETSVFKKSSLQQQSASLPTYKWNLVWRNVLAFVYLHVFTLYAMYLIIYYAKSQTIIWAVGLGFVAGQGVTAGAHRLWAHRTYKAKLPLRIFLATLQTISFQNHLYEWVRDHRVHHKFTDTDADPHNAKRGFFFSHIGWLMLKKHQDVFLHGRKVDLSDLREDPVIMFQKKYYLILAPLLSFVFPTFVPWYFWNETFWNSWYISGVFRYTMSLNVTWLVNSAAHIWGVKPYDKSIAPTENVWVAVMAHGEGWHNYHHVFPWDYKAAELGNYRMNFSTAFIDFMHYIGQAYDMKTATKEMIERRSQRTGDGSRICTKKVESNPEYHSSLDDGNHLWGWGDKDMSENDVEFVLKTNNLKER